MVGRDTSFTQQATMAYHPTGETVEILGIRAANKGCCLAAFIDTRKRTDTEPSPGESKKRARTNPTEELKEDSDNSTTNGNKSPFDGSQFTKFV